MPRNLITGHVDRDYLDKQQITNDLVYAYGGDDVIDSGPGNDLIYAGTGADHVIGGDGHDKVYGGDGDDVLVGSSGDDTLYGDAGADVLLDAFGTDVLYGGGDDDLLSSGGVSPFGENHLFGGVGNDRLTFLGGNFGAADGGDGNDVADVSFHSGFGWPSDAVVVSMMAGSGTVSHKGRVLTLTGIESLYLEAGFGDDTVQSGAGNDVLVVYYGANVVDAGAGDDRVAWDTGSINVLEGGLGNDTLVVTHSSASSGLVFSAAGGVVSDGYGSSLTGFERFEILGSTLNDRAVFGDGANRFTGWSGNDTAIGGAGHDFLRGQLGDDLLQGEGGTDWLNGGFGNDVMDGGLGNDVFLGGLGSDTLTGGAGADRFRFYAPEQYFDHITDFTVGLDKLVFYRSYLGLTPDASPTDPGFLAINAPDSTHGQFVFFDSSAGNPPELRWDADGTGISGGLTIAILHGIDHLTTADFTLMA